MTTSLEVRENLYADLSRTPYLTHEVQPDTYLGAMHGAIHFAESNISAYAQAEYTIDTIRVLVGQDIIDSLRNQFTVGAHDAIVIGMGDVTIKTAMQRRLGISTDAQWLDLYEEARCDEFDIIIAAADSGKIDADEAAARLDALTDSKRAYGRILEFEGSIEKYNQWKSRMANPSENTGKIRRILDRVRPPQDPAEKYGFVDAE